MLGRFEVEKELGRGAMGIVYLARDTSTGEAIAIKTMALAEEFDEDELAEVKRRFFREADAAEHLQHPNIVNVFNTGDDNGLAYIAMEFLHGHDLSRYCYPDNLLSVQDVIDIIINAASALNYAHEKQVVHRDIKPANIMYLPEIESIKITDFGIARVAETVVTRTGRIFGTPSYMSPEQLYGRPVDGRSDLFSLGVTFYELMTGKLPFEGESLAELIDNIAGNRYVTIEAANPARAEIAPGTSKIIEKALHKNVEKRYQSGAEMIQDLEACSDALAKRLILS